MDTEMDKMMGMDPKEYRTTGWIFLIMGIIGMIFPFFMSTFVVYMIGFFLIIGGIVFAFTGEKSAWMKWLMAILFFILGMMVIINPYYSILAVGLLMGIFFLISGFATLFIGFTSLNDGGWLLVVNGIISLLLAGMVLAGWPYDATWMVGLFVGIYLLFEGVALLTMGKQAEMKGGSAVAE